MTMFLLLLGALAMVFCVAAYPWHCLTYLCFCGIVMALTYRSNRPPPVRFETERERDKRIAKKRKG